MRLLSSQNDGQLSITGDVTDNIPPYAVLSHTWGNDEEEVTFRDVCQDISLNTKRQKHGYRKIGFCGTQAAAHDLQHFWIDTCCINKESATELQEAITSMFRWYQNSARCYVYLPDVYMDDTNSLAWQSDFRRSRWFRRGWTLQELLAPSSVEFFDREGRRLGDKTSLIGLLHQITNISIEALRGRSVSTFSIDERMLWARGRETKRKEDKAYCLLGIFGVSMFLNYGEGEEHAMRRILEDIQQSPGAQEQVPKCIVPLGRNKGFVGRNHFIDKLLKMLLPDADLQDCQRIAIEGLGGIGKTQIALETTFRLQERDPTCSVFWIPAVSRATFENGFREIDEALSIPGINDEKADVNALVTKALNKSPSKWVLIIDNADDIELVFGSADNYSISDHLPFNTKGSILFTTRTHEVTARLDISPDETLTINELSAGEALEMLGRAVKPKQVQNTNSAKALLEVLAHLPLAIKQAAAYMARTGITTEKYLEQYDRSDANRRDLLSRNFEDRWRYKEIANPIATTWLVSFTHIEKEHPLAARYLIFISFLGGKDIPKSLLTGYIEEAGSDEAIGVLQGYSFITERDDGESFDIHRLVRLATRNSIGNAVDQHFTAVLQQLTRIIPNPVHENRHIWVRYMPHMEAILSVNHADGNDMDTAQLFRKMGHGYLILGAYRAAQPMFFHALQLVKEKQGPTHHNTLISMSEYAAVLLHLGKYNDAELIHRQVFELQKEKLGLKHPETLTCINELAYTLRKSRKYTEAEQMYRQIQHLRASELGPKGVDRLVNIGNLGIVLGHLGKYEEAEQMLSQALQLKIEQLGPKHTLTHDGMNNLGLALGDLRRFEEAEQMLSQVLQLKIEQLGPRHPATLDSINNLAVTTGLLGKYEEAEQMHSQVLQLKIEQLGPKHPLTLNSYEQSCKCAL